MKIQLCGIVFIKGRLPAQEQLQLSLSFDYSVTPEEISFLTIQYTPFT